MSVVQRQRMERGQGLETLFGPANNSGGALTHLDGENALQCPVEEEPEKLRSVWWVSGQCVGNEREEGQKGFVCGADGCANRWERRNRRRVYLPAGQP